MDEFYNDLIERNKIIESWPLTQSFIPIFIVMVLYLYFAIILGPQFMKNRQSYELKNILLIYNAFQVIYNLWQCIMFDITKSLPYLFKQCHNIRNDAYKQMILEMSWWFMINKFIDLFDTLFMILRKKFNQINLLHLYHHPSTLFMAWAHLVYGPGEHHVVVWYMNSLVHVIMYSYYFVAGLGQQYQKYLWWKKYLTSLQILQFVLILLYILVMFVYCKNIPVIFIILFSLNPLLLLTLFSNFYFKTYESRKKKLQKVDKE